MTRPSASLPTSTPRAARLAHGPAFWAIAATTVTFLAASSAPSPLYAVYQAEWGFSTGTLTEIFGVYAIALLGSLLVFGALSDHVGRRPVLGAAIALEAVALVLFLVAGGVPALIVARIVQGVATGAAISTLGATLIDLQPAHAPKRGGLVNGVAPLGGLAAGALGCGLLIELAPSPTTLVFVVLLVLFAFAAVAVALMPETSPRRAGARASLKPRVGLPAHLRADVIALLPAFVASWSLGGLYLSLGPSVAATMLGLESRLVGGIVVALMCGTGAVTALVLRERDPQQLLRQAAVLLAAGMVVTLVGLEADVAAVAGIGTVVAGVGFGSAALGGFGSLARLAGPEERGEVFSVAFVVSYLAFSIPAIAAGFAATSVGLRTVALVYGAYVVLIALAAVAGTRRTAARMAAA